MKYTTIALPLICFYINALYPLAIWGFIITVNIYVLLLLQNKPLYVNYATRQDFKILRTLTLLDYRGSICIARLGRISLALMVRHMNLDNLGH